MTGGAMLGGGAGRDTPPRIPLPGAGRDCDGPASPEGAPALPPPRPIHPSDRLLQLQPLAALLEADCDEVLDELLGIFGLRE